MDKEDLNNLANKVIGIAIKVHKELGPGFTEKTYCKALAYELTKNNIQHINEGTIRVRYEGLLLGNQRIDFLVEDELILEIKAAKEINRVFINQLLSYLKASKKKLGLI